MYFENNRKLFSTKVKTLNLCLYHLISNVFCLIDVRLTNDVKLFFENFPLQVDSALQIKIKSYPFLEHVGLFLF